MKTAEELADKLLADFYPEHVVAVIREAQRDALESAAMAECYGCRENGFPLVDEDGDWLHGRMPCNSNSIHDIISELPNA